MVPIKIRLDSDDHYDGGNTKEHIAVHDTGNFTDSDEGNANYFCTGTRNASAHVFIDDDSITQVVLDDDCAFGVGDGNGAYGITNRNSLNVEMCRVNGVVTEKTLFNTMEWIRLKMTQYNIPLEKIVRHWDASRKNCPSSLSANNWARWWDFKAKIGQAIQPVPASIGEWLRVRSNWLDITTQKGAYTVLQNAIDCANANPGYEVYNSLGAQIYPAPVVIREIVSAPVTPMYDEIPFSTETLRVQVAMNRLGFKGLNGLRLAEDGKDGVNTQFAIKKFQAVMGLLVDGDPGINTWGAIDEIFAKPYDSAPTIQHYEYATRYIQWRVGAPITGTFNWDTARLVAIWQGQKGLHQDGVVGSNTWYQLIG